MKLIRYSPAFIPVFLLLLANSSSSLYEKEINKAVVSSSVAIVEKTILNSAELFDKWNLNAAGLSKEAFEMATKGFTQLADKHLLLNSSLLTIIDFSKPSTQKRLYVLDMVTGKVLFNSLVAHGRNSGCNFAKAFSNKQESYKSSLGFYTTLNTYNGTHGYSLKLKGFEKGINDNAYSRAIVLHGADYVSETFVQRNGYLGRSEGCPAVPKELSKDIIDIIKGGSCIFLYYPSKIYYSRSKILNS
jgi:L,D-transpeptidase catalytic domain